VAEITLALVTLAALVDCLLAVAVAAVHPAALGVLEEPVQTEW
jgi:hypothetical protein